MLRILRSELTTSAGVLCNQFPASMKLISYKGIYRRWFISLFTAREGGMEISGGVSGICCGVCGIDWRGLPAINLQQYWRRHKEINVTQALCANKHKSVVTRSTWVTVTRRIEESVLHMMTVTCGEAQIGAYYASCEPLKRKLNKGCTFQDKWTITTQY